MDTLIVIVVKLIRTLLQHLRRYAFHVCVSIDGDDNCVSELPHSVFHQSLHLRIECAIQLLPGQVAHHHNIYVEFFLL